jgi:ATP-binding cassette subfamily B protein
VLGPLQSGLSSAVKWRIVYRIESRLIEAVSGPVGISHLEDASVLNDVALAQGQLVNQRTAEAPMTLANVISNRAGGLIACLVLASFRWWLGLGMAVMWILVRRPQMTTNREMGRRGSPPTRRSPRSRVCSGWAAGWWTATARSFCSA